MNKVYVKTQLMYTPTSPKDAVTKEYVDQKAEGSRKDAVRAVSAQNLDATYSDKVLTLTAQGALVVDGVTMAVGDRLLVAGQTDATQNGIYVVTDAGSDESSEGAGDGTAAVLTRAADFSDGGQIKPGVAVYVNEGESGGDIDWNLVNDSPVVIDTTPLSFSKAKGSDGANIVTGTFQGDGTATEFVITHGLNSEQVVVSIVDKATKEICFFGVEITSANTVTIKTDVVLESTDEFEVTIVG